MKIYSCNHTVLFRRSLFHVIMHYYTMLWRSVFVHFCYFPVFLCFYHVCGAFQPIFHYLPFAVAFYRPAHKFGCVFAELVDIFFKTSVPHVHFSQSLQDFQGAFVVVFR